MSWLAVKLVDSCYFEFGGGTNRAQGSGEYGSALIEEDEAREESEHGEHTHSSYRWWSRPSCWGASRLDILPIHLPVSFLGKRPCTVVL